MAASASPSSGGHGNACNGNNNGGKSNGGGKDNGNDTESVSSDDPVKPAHVAFRHNPGLSLDWTYDEQYVLKDLMKKYACESTVFRYAVIAKALGDKTVRDVALYCRWMSLARGRLNLVLEIRASKVGKGGEPKKKKERGKMRKDEIDSRKNKEKREKVTDLFPRSPQVANCFNGPPYAQSMMSMDGDDGMPFEAIGGAAGQLLEQNADALDQISTNFSACKIQENINLFCQTRSNIVSLLNDLKDVSEIMKQMPPLPVKLNDELANSILPRTFEPKKP